MSTSKKNNFKILVTGGSGRFARALKKNTGKYNMIFPNKSEFNINLNLNSQISQNKLELSYVFPIPNPFSNNTDFTMISSHFPINININVFSNCNFLSNSGKDFI